MSVQGIGGGGARSIPDPEDRAPPLPEIERMRGQAGEEDTRAAIDARYGGSLNRAAGLVDGALSLVGFRPLNVRVPTTLRNLPSFELEGKDGTRVSSELTEVRGPDGKDHPGVIMEWKRPGEPAKRFIYSDEIRFPARPGDWNPAGIERHPFFGELGREVPLSIRHTIAARRTADALKDYFLVACDFPAKGPGATEREALAAHSIANHISSTISRFETTAGRSPEAKLLIEVYEGITSGSLRDAGALEKAIADLEAAAGTIDGRTALDPEDRALVRSDLATVRRMAEEWLRSGDRSNAYR